MKQKMFSILDLSAFKCTSVFKLSLLYEINLTVVVNIIIMHKLLLLEMNVLEVARAYFVSLNTTDPFHQAIYFHFIVRRISFYLIVFILIFN